MNFPDRVVVDTNVLIVANGNSSQATGDCVDTAIEFLEHAEANAVVVLDDDWEIMEEYQNYCSYRGQPGMGDRFFLHLHRLQADSRRVQKVKITPDGEGSYEEVPEQLSAFDPSDQKFVAVVLADSGNAKVVNCVDSDWHLSKAQLDSCGIDVIELCPSCVKSI